MGSFAANEVQGTNYMDLNYAQKCPHQGYKNIILIYASTVTFAYKSLNDLYSMQSGRLGLINKDILLQIGNAFSGSGSQQHRDY